MYNDEIKRLIEYLKNKDGIMSISIVGSYIEQKEYNDIDFLITCNGNAKKMRQTIMNELKQYGAFITDDSVKFKNSSGKELSLAFYQHNKLLNNIKLYMNGKNLEPRVNEWALVGWFPEALLYDIKNMFLIYDSNSDMSNIKNKLNVYPFKMRKGMIEFIDKKLSNLSARLNNCDKTEYDLIQYEKKIWNIRREYALKEIYFRGFKNIDEKIKQDFNYTNKIFYGTWELDGKIKPISEKQAANLIRLAKENGINRFDTALAYGNGNVEKILGAQLEDNDVVLTKIPAKQKPSLNEENVKKFYNNEWIEECINKSLKNLKRDKIDIVLFHNWSRKWDNETGILKYLSDKKNIIKKIGISLPNNFNKRLNKNLLKYIDIIEVPYNVENIWIENDIDYYKENGIEVIFRSLFLQGKLLESAKNKNEIAKKILKNAQKYNVNLVIGMTTEKQIKENIQILNTTERDEN